jgi:hypothetical protein
VTRTVLLLLLLCSTQADAAALLCQKKNGLVILRGSATCRSNETNLGALGEVGPPGPIGPVGPMGAQGLQGLPGFNGAMGVPGATGAPGPLGPTGLGGAFGPTIARIAVDSRPAVSLSTTLQAQADCGPGEHLLSGGFVVGSDIAADRGRVVVIFSMPTVGAHGWITQAVATVATRGRVSLTTAAFCALP